MVSSWTAGDIGGVDEGLLGDGKEGEVLTGDCVGEERGDVEGREE